tara:strand:- start:2609 stop:3427 length:819 start_codon:yes stop_codon:yes gene_type:complete
MTNVVSDNFEGTLDTEDNSDEIGFENNGVEEDGYAGHEQEASSEDSGDAFWNGNPEELSDELKPVYKNMQAAFTKRMQRASDLEQKYMDSIEAANAVLVSGRGQGAPQENAPVEEVKDIPDMSKGAKPEEVIDYYVQQAVGEAIKKSGINSVIDQVQPLANQQKVVSAYQKYAAENPGMNHQTIAGQVGQILDTDADLGALAATNPDAAIRIAAQMAQSNVATTNKRSKEKQRRQAAPVSARQGSVKSRRKESMLDAATRALKEAGLQPDGF